MTDTTMAIVGSGVAGVRAVEALREGGYDGRVVLVGSDPRLPYDRPPLSKAVLAGAESESAAVLHPAAWYDDQRVELRLDTEVTRLDPGDHTLELADGSTLAWDRLLLATGSSVRRLEVPGADLAHVHYLRTMSQATALRERLEAGGAVVLVGAGWIGLEVAAAARGYDCQVTVIEPQRTPLEGVLGPRLGEYFAQLHTSHGVRFRQGAGVERLLGNETVTGVLTDAGEEITADTVVVGVGVTPNTGLAKQAGLEVGDGIICDAALRTSAPDVFAAGDVASWLHPALDRRIRVDHWANAHEGGYLAGRSMLGEDVSYDALPYFFSDQYDIGLEYVGHVPRGSSTEVVLRGDPSAGAFLAFWLAEGRVLAGMHVNAWDSIDEIRALVARGSVVDPQRLADPDRPLLAVSNGSA